MGCFRRRRDGTDKKNADVTTFSLQHLKDQLNLLPIESNYCTSGFIHYYLLFVCSPMSIVLQNTWFWK